MTKPEPSGEAAAAAAPADLSSWQLKVPPVYSRAQRQPVQLPERSGDETEATEEYDEDGPSPSASPPATVRTQRNHKSRPEPPPELPSFILVL